MPVAGIRVRSDNGPGFTSKVFLKWADENNMDIHFIKKGKPTQKVFVESL